MASPFPFSVYLSVHPFVRATVRPFVCFFVRVPVYILLTFCGDFKILWLGCKMIQLHPFIHQSLHPLVLDCFADKFSEKKTLCWSRFSYAWPTNVRIKDQRDKENRTVQFKCESFLVRNVHLMWNFCSVLLRKESTLLRKTGLDHFLQGISESSSSVPT